MINIPETLVAIADQLRNQSADTIESKPRKEQVKYLCELLGIEMQDLAFARLYRTPTMTAQQLAMQIGVTTRTLYRWPEVSRLLSKRRDLL